MVDMVDKVEADPEETLRLAAEIVAAYVSANHLEASEIPTVIRNVYVALDSLVRGAATPDEDRPAPAVPIEKSITPDYLVCLEDGKKLKMLKRYLRTHYGMSPDDYRKKWGLATDYPMVAPNYAKRRSEFAKQIGLGRSAGRGRG